MARNRIAALPGETEIERSLMGKTFLQADGRIRAVHSIAPVHWHDGVEWLEIDDTPTSPDGGKTWTTPSTPYILTWDSETLTLAYQSKKGGDIRVRLAALDGIAVGPQKELPVVNGQAIRASVAPDLEIELRVRPLGVEIFKVLNGPSAPRSLTWEVVEGDTTNIAVNLMDTRGRDNQLNTQARKLEDSLNQRRAVELTHEKSEVDFLANPGKASYSVTESFTGKTQFIDPETRARTFVDEVQWPVVIDVTVTETIVADDDDGNGVANGKWYSQNFNGYWSVGAAFSHDDHGGVRFQSVAVPQGQVLDSAILTINVVAHGSGTQSGTLAGEAVDDASSWANYSTNSPKTMAATAASVSVAAYTTNGTKTIDVKTICQEIFNRAGWAQGSVRLGWTDVTGMGASYFQVEDYHAVGTAQAQLVIVYTAGGSAGNIAWIKA